MTRSAATAWWHTNTLRCFGSIRNLASRTEPEWSTSTEATRSTVRVHLSFLPSTWARLFAGVLLDESPQSDQPANSPMRATEPKRGGLEAHQAGSEIDTALLVLAIDAKAGTIGRLR